MNGGNAFEAKTRGKIVIHERKETKSSGSHSFWMILCCAIPLAGVVVLSFLGILGVWGVYALILLCPLLHLLFMRKMAPKDMHKVSSENDMIGEGK
ncbi:MAG: hypothetical protein GTO13_03720 [Proteobacteria bacterium]|nr:hypothetical protein [Pseudomonadota bacterium]